ncbi:MAG: PepSY domain-containing protein [Caulobacter sp.]|nr:PepSY domain-containing protein [Caulobacter sp.]
MNRLVALFAAALISAGLPAVAEAQSRGRPSDCPGGVIGQACREVLRDQRDDGPSRPPGRGGNSLGDGWSPRESEARDGVRGGRLVSLETVIRSIARSNPGQLLDAGLENRGGRPVYRVRWQTNDGRRIDFIVDATTGQIIGRN